MNQDKHSTNKIFCSDTQLIQKSGKKFKWNSQGLKLFNLQLDKFHNEVIPLKACLNEEEVKKAGRFFFNKDRQRYIICRSVLKILLAQLTDQDISTIHLKQNKGQKPYLPQHPNICFNLSYSKNQVLITIDEKMIGVDIEKVESTFDYTSIIREVFTKEEVIFVNASKNHAKTFYKLWTRKEAIVKAIGIGIEDSFKQISCLNGANDQPSSWMSNYGNLHVLSFQLFNDYVGTIASLREEIPSVIYCQDITKELLFE